MAPPGLFSHLLILLSVNAIIFREVIYNETCRLQDNKVTVTVYPVYPRTIKVPNAIPVIKILFIPAR